MEDYLSLHYLPWIGPVKTLNIFVTYDKISGKFISHHKQ